jgi:hypothetical protein
MQTSTDTHVYRHVLVRLDRQTDGQTPTHTHTYTHETNITNTENKNHMPLPEERVSREEEEADEVDCEIVC